MIRVVLYIVVLALLAYAGMLIVQNPGHVTMTWGGKVVEAPAALLVVAVALAAIVLWSVIRLVFGLPSFVKLTARQRRREKGYAALSRGLIAVGSGDARTAGRAAGQAGRHLKGDPLAVMLRAQAAHLGGEGHVANAAFEELAQRDDTRVLGLRGLHAEAMRRGDEEAARHFAHAAHRATPLPWSAKAVLEHRAAEGDWEKALSTVETGLAAGLIEKETGERQRAVLETAIALDKETAAPDAALVLARAAMRRAPDLAPPIALATRLLARRGDIRKAARLVEKAWPRCQHPEIAQAYLEVRPGDSTQDRLTRAKTLMGIASYDPVGRMTVARAAFANRDFATAREAMAPLIAEGKRPTVRQCLMMAELDESEHGDTGLWREWLARAARAPLDPAWIADGIIYDRWGPASPTSGKLDAFQWQVPAERLGPAMDAMPMPARKNEAITAEATPALAHEPVEAESAGEKPVVFSPPVAPLEPLKEAPPAPALRPEARDSDSPLFHRKLAEETEPAPPRSNGASIYDDGHGTAAATETPPPPAAEARTDERTGRSEPILLPDEITPPRRPTSH